MIESSHFIFSVFVGIIAGIIFFGGLWYTTQHLTTWKYPALWLPLSFFSRTVIALGAFYWVGNGSLPRMGACLVGFLIGRTIIFYNTRAKQAVESNAHQKELWKGDRKCN